MQRTIKGGKILEVQEFEADKVEILDVLLRFGTLANRSEDMQRGKVNGQEY